MATQTTKQFEDMVYDIDYKLFLLMQDIGNIKNSINNLKDSQETLKQRLTCRYGFLKQVLLQKCKDKLEQGDRNDYVSMLTALYKITETKQRQFVDVSIDTSPTWMIAEAVLAEPEPKDRNAWIDMFIYAFKTHPGMFFEPFT